MELLALLLSAGGAAFLVAIFNGIKSIRSTKNESEEALLTRINKDAEQAHQDADAQRERAINAEQMANTLRKQRDDALEKISSYKIILLEAGIEIPPHLK